MRITNLHESSRINTNENRNHFLGSTQTLLFLFVKIRVNSCRFVILFLLEYHILGYTPAKRPCRERKQIHAIHFPRRRCIDRIRQHNPHLRRIDDRHGRSARLPAGIVDEEVVIRLIHRRHLRARREEDVDRAKIFLNRDAGDRVDRWRRCRQLFAAMTTEGDFLDLDQLGRPRLEGLNQRIIEPLEKQKLPNDPMIQLHFTPTNQRRHRRCWCSAGRCPAPSHHVGWPTGK